MLLTALAWFYLFALLLGRTAWFRRLAEAFSLRLRRRALGYRRLSPRTAPHFVRRAAKRVWVRREIIRLKALMPEAGCRRIADSFNRRFAARRRMTVGKTFVSEFLREHRYEVEVELDIDFKTQRGNSPLRQATGGQNRQRSGLHLAGLSLGPLPARRPASENRSRLSLAERQGRALLRHAQGEARSPSCGIVCGAQSGIGRVPFLLQPCPAASESFRPHAGRSLGRR